MSISYLSPLSFLVIACASGQSLFELAPAADASESIPLTWTSSLNIGYDSNIAMTRSIANEWATQDPEAGRAWLDSIDSGTGNRTREIESSFHVGYYADYVWRGLTAQEASISLDAYLSIVNSTSSANLITDAALLLDDRFGFETADMKTGYVRFNVAAINSENKSTSTRRQTQGLRADLDFGLNDHMTVGIDLIYANGEAGSGDIDSFGFGFDGTINGKLNGMNWELGAGLGAIKGNLYDSGGSGEQFASILTAYAALQKGDISIGGFDGYWEVGIKERIVFRDDATESGGSLNLNLRYDDELISTTVGNLELGLSLTDKILLQLALNPVIFHSGGDISTNTSGLGILTSTDRTGYDVHTARAGLSAIINDTTTFNTNVIIGDDSSWGASIGFSIDL